MSDCYPLGPNFMRLLFRRTSRVSAIWNRQTYETPNILISQDTPQTIISRNQVVHHSISVCLKYPSGGKLSKEFSHTIRIFMGRNMNLAQGMNHLHSQTSTTVEDILATMTLRALSALSQRDPPHWWSQLDVAVTRDGDSSTLGISSVTTEGVIERSTFVWTMRLKWFLVEVLIRTGPCSTQLEEAACGSLPCLDMLTATNLRWLYAQYRPKHK